MHNIKEEIQVLLVRNGISMRKLIMKMKQAGYKMPEPSSLSVMLSRNTIRYSIIQDILDFLGYKLEIAKK